MNKEKMFKKLFIIGTLTLALSLVSLTNVSSAATNGNLLSKSKELSIFNNRITRLAIRTLPNKITYIKGEELDLTGGTLVAISMDGKAKSVLMNSRSVNLNGYDSSKLGIQEITVSYENLKTKFYVKVEEKQNDSIEEEKPVISDDNMDKEHTIYSITIIQAPTVTRYYRGDELYLGGGTIRITYTDGTTRDISMLDENVEVIGYDASKAEEQTLTVKYKGIESNNKFAVNVEKNVVDLSVKKLPDKTIYTKGEEIDLTGGEISLTYDDGSSILYNMSDLEAIANAYNPDLVGSQTLNITYQGKVASFKVNVKEAPKNTERLQITKKPNKLTYTKGEKLDLTGGEILVESATYNTQIGSAIAKYKMTDSKVHVTGYNANKVGTQTLIVSFDGMKATSTFNINVKEAPKNTERLQITKKPNKLTYTKGEKLDLTGGEILVESATYNTQIGSAIAKYKMTDSKVHVTGYNANKVGTQTLIVSFDGMKATSTFNVNVKEAPKNTERLQITKKPNKLTYNKGEKLDLTGGEILVESATYNTQTGSAIAKYKMTDSKVHVTGYNANKVGTQTLIVSFDGMKATSTFNVNVKEAPKNTERIQITKQPNKLTYIKGDKLDLTGGEILVESATYNTQIGSAIAKYKMTDSKVHVTGYNANKVGTQTLTVSFDGMKATAKFNVQVIQSSKLTSIRISKNPTKNTYVKEDAKPLDFSGGILELTYSNGSKKTISMTNANITSSRINYNKNGWQTIYVYYEGKATSFKVYVITNKVAKINISKMPNKIKYSIGEKLDLTGGQIYVTYEDGRAGNILMTHTGVTVSGYNAKKVGSQKITVKYGGKSTTYTVSVVSQSNTVSSISVSKKPTKTVYYKEDGIPLNFAGGTLLVRYSNGTSKTISMTASGVSTSGYNYTKLGWQTVKMYYQGKSTTFQVYVTSKNPTSIKVKTMPTKTVYIKGEKLSLTGGTLLATYLDGHTNTVSMTQATATGYNANKIGTQTITLKYQGKTTTFKITVQESAKITKFFVTRLPNKTVYQKGEKLDLTGGCVQANYNTKKGVAFAMASSGVTVSGYNANKVGTQTITLKYQGLTTTFKVTVKDISADQFNAQFMPYSCKQITGAVAKTVIQKIINNNKISNGRQIRVRLDLDASDKYYSGTSIPTTSISNNSKYIVTFGYNSSGYITMITFSEYNTAANFNAQFMPYSCKQITGTEAKTVIQKIIASNKDVANKNRQIRVRLDLDTSDIYYSGTSIPTTKIKNNTKYIVTFGYNSAGYITMITFSEHNTPQDFNAKFNQYKSKKITGTQVKTVVQQIINNNADSTNRQIKVRLDLKASDKYYSGTSIPTTSIKAAGKYVVTFGYNSEGYITLITFSEL